MKEKFFCFGKNGFCDQSNDDVDRCRKCKHYDGSGGDLRMQEKPPRLDREAWCAEWVEKTDDDGCVWFECSACEQGLDSMDEQHPFCPSCGRAMTDDAWQILEKRMEGME